MWLRSNVQSTVDKSIAHQMMAYKFSGGIFLQEERKGIIVSS